MSLQKHYFMTFIALFFLGLMVTRQGSTQAPKRECKLDRGKMACEVKQPEYYINSAVMYQYR